MKRMLFLVLAVVVAPWAVPPTLLAGTPAPDSDKSPPTAASSKTAAGEAPTKPAEPEKYLLRYKFHPGQMLRWDVYHQTSVRTTVGRTSQEVETLTTSIKAWQVKNVDAHGLATFEHRVESIDMRQQVEGRPPVRYNSRTDQRPPPEFEDVAKSVGVPLVVVTMDGTGTITKRERTKLKLKTNPATDTQMTVPLPQEPIAVGHTWKVPNQVDVRTPAGLSQRVQIEQRFTLEEVRTGVATIAVTTRILTPVRDPSIEAQLTQQESTGKIRFDVDTGCVLWQQIDRDKRVIGFQGQASSMHYLTRFTETLLHDQPKLASAGDGGAAK